MKNETDLLIRDNYYYHIRITENLIRLNQISLRDGIFNPKEFKKIDTKLQNKLSKLKESKLVLEDRSF